MSVESVVGRFLFDEFSKLPADLLPTGRQVRKLCSHCVRRSPEGSGLRRSFDWQTFHKIVSNYKGDDLTIDRYKETNINQVTSTLSAMVDKIVNALIGSLPLELGEEDVAALKAHMIKALANLKDKQDEGAADVSPPSNEGSWKGSTCEYRVLFGFPNPDLPGYFYDWVTTVKLTADVKEESEWMGLTSDTSKSFTAVINAMSLVVQKGFEDPSGH